MTNQSVHCFIIMLVFLFFAAAVPFAAGQAAGSPSRPQHQYLMVIIMVVLICVFFMLGFFLIYVHQWVEVGRNGRVVRPMNGVVGSIERGKRGLDLDVIETFPIVNYSDVKLLKIGKGELECAVCLNEFEDDETLRLLPKCDHVFHPECIDEWLVDHVTCPVCRANLKPESIDVVVTDDVAAPAAREVSADSDEMNNEVSEVRISMTDDQDAHSEVININQTSIQTRPVRLDSTRIDRKFPRSHSTPILSLRENYERFTLRLPDDVRKRIVTGRLNRTTSFCFASSPTGDGNAKSDRWIFSMAPPFFTRTSSVKSLKVTDGDGSFGGNTSFVLPRGLCNSVKLPLPFDCLGGKESTDNVGLPV